MGRALRGPHFLPPQSPSSPKFLTFSEAGSPLFPHICELPNTPPEIPFLDKVSVTYHQRTLVGAEGIVRLHGIKQMLLITFHS